jgi:RNA polymerase sigma-70 factor (ECF subfamily)
MAESRIDPRDRQIVEQAYERLRHFGEVIAPDGAEGDDLLQEALVRTLRTHCLQDLDHPLPYLRRVMVNLAANQRRRAGVRARVFARIAADAAPASDAYPSDLAELMALPPKAKAALYLAEIDGYTYAEIGRMLGCSEAAARKNASRARRQLRAATALEAGS